MPTILVIDDETSVRQMIREMLADEGYTVLIAQHGQEALSYLRVVVVDGISLSHDSLDTY